MPSSRYKTSCGSPAGRPLPQGARGPSRLDAPGDVGGAVALDALRLVVVVEPLGKVRSLADVHRRPVTVNDLGEDVVASLGLQRGSDKVYVVDVLLAGRSRPSARRCLVSHFLLLGCA